MKGPIGPSVCRGQLTQLTDQQKMSKQLANQSKCVERSTRWHGRLNEVVDGLKCVKKSTQPVDHTAWRVESSSRLVGMDGRIRWSTIWSKDWRKNASDRSYVKKQLYEYVDRSQRKCINMSMYITGVETSCSQFMHVI